MFCFRGSLLHIEYPLCEQASVIFRSVLTEWIKDNKETGQQPRDQRRAPPDLDPSYLPQDINEAYQAFPFSLHHRPRETTQASIECLLPPIERAIGYCEIFMEHLSWFAKYIS